ncbi:MAG: hypothetical protein BVN33_16955 [Proteobacteria bacterium ST_bin13]|nr:MAG: hypothetical protein BVN33_16955 [Proteobacteria bacterium ST_bin13]
MATVAPTSRMIQEQDDRVRTRRSWAYGLIAAVIWGGFLVASRHAIGAGLHPTDLAFLRYLVAGAILLPWFVRRSPHRLGGMGWRKGVTLAVLAGPLFVIVSSSGYRFAPLAHGAVIQLGMLTLVSILLAAVFVGERPGKRRIVGILVIIAGLAVAAGQGLMAGSPTAWVGDLLFATAGSMWALFTVLQRRWTIAPLSATAVVSVLSAAVYVPAYLAENGLRLFASASPAMLVEQILVQGVLSGVIALFAFARAVQNLGAGRAALFPALAPGVAMLIGIPVTGEIPTAIQILGLLILSGGLLIAVRGDPAASNRR